MNITLSKLVPAGLALLVPPLMSHAASLQRVAEFPHQQVTGVTVSPSGRIFVNFPFWVDGHTVSVAEVKGGTIEPYPNQDWNRPVFPVEKRFVCVQSVVADQTNNLWIVDAGSPKQSGVIPGGAKLVKVDLGTNTVTGTILFSDQVAPKKSYLNDIRIDTKNHFGILTESTTGCLIVVNLATGEARQVLAHHLSTKVELDYHLAVDGVAMIDPETEKTVAFQADSLAMDEAGGWIYYKALTARALYRVRVADLENPGLGDDELGRKVEKVGNFFATDGLEFRGGAVYLTSPERNAIVRYDVARKQSVDVVVNDQLRWPDTLSWGPDGALYVTTSQIHLTPKFHQGENKVTEPFALFRIEGASK